MLNTKVSEKENRPKRSSNCSFKNQVFLLDLKNNRLELKIIMFIEVLAWS
jgi:hypothetical protein